VVRGVDIPAATVLAGAGVSRDAGFPIAYELLDAITDCVIKRPRARDEIKRLARWDRADRHSEHDFLRFETFVDWVLEVYGGESALFAFMDHFTAPTAIQRALARAAGEGLRLVTVNFDDLLERAIQEEFPGRGVRTIDAHARSGSVRDDAIAILKLHGTRWIYSRAGRRRSPRSLQTTIQTIAATSPNFAFAGHARKLFDEALEGRELVVVGYSGSDTLDVMPSLERSSPSRVIWIEHRWDAVVAHALDSAAIRARPWHAALRALADRGAEVTVLAGPTAECLDLVGIPERATPLATPPRWEEAIRSWAREVQDHDPTGLGTAALLLGELGRYDECLWALRRARASPLAEGRWTEARRLYEIGQAHLLKEHSNLAWATRYAEAASREAALAAQPERDIEMMASLLLGRAHFLRQHYGEARRAFARAQKRTEHGSANWAFAEGWRGRCFAWENRAREAIPHLSSAAAVFRREGELESLLDAEQALGIAHAVRPDVATAEAHFREALRIADILGWRDRQSAATFGLASLAFDRSRLDVALQLAEDAQRLHAAPENAEASQAWQLIGDIRLEQDELDQAHGAFQAALATETVVTRYTRCKTIAKSAEIMFLCGSASEARRLARAALGLQPQYRTWSGRVNGVVVLTAVGERSAAGLSGLLQPPRRAAPADLVQLGMTLIRLGLDGPETRRFLMRARREAIHLSDTRRAAALSGH
jgi:tetratricopeptide (TPR) repeat protein